MILPAIFLIVALLTPSYPQQPSASIAQRTRTLKVSASSILEDVSKRKKTQPAITSKELAVYANELLKERGSNYMFDVCDIVPKRDRKSTLHDVPANYKLSLTNGEKRSFRFTVPGEDLSGNCGECFALVPSFQVTSREMLFIAEGKRYRVRRPASFILDQAELVDATLKKVLRTWQLPYQAIPVGISADGAKLYLDFYTDYELDDLVLEVTETGDLAFRARSEIDLGEGKFIEDHPKDPANNYLSFMRFQAGNKTYIVRFSAPCT